ncbi:hypothetical protein GCM10027020_24840 [Nocardioides salsibiostraticola]
MSDQYYFLGARRFAVRAALVAVAALVLGLLAANPASAARGLATISGEVTLPEGASRYQDGQIRLRDTQTGEVVAKASLRRGSNYTFRGVQAGSYRVTFNRISGQAYAAAQYFDGVAEHEGSDAATPVVVRPGEDRLDVNAALVVGGSVVGRLVDSDGLPMAGCLAQALSPDRTLITRSDRTNKEGYFSIGGLSTGAYTVRIAGGTGGCRFGTQHLVADGTPLSLERDDAVPVDVTIGEATTLTSDVVYATGSAIRGMVSVPEGHGDSRAGAVVVRDFETGELARRVRVKRSGEYAVRGLTEGSYRVTFNRISGFSSLAAQFYRDSVESNGRGGATPVTVGDRSVTGIDASLATGGSISGRLVDAQGGKVRYCQVQALDPRTVRRTRPGASGRQHLVTRSEYVQRDGTFTVGGLSTGAYVLKVSGRRGACREARFLADDGTLKTGPVSASHIDVVLGEDTEVGDVESPVQSSGITGTLPTRLSYDERVVVIRDAATGARVRTARANYRSGYYSARGLAAGTYRVTFNRLSGYSRYAAEFFDGVPESGGRGEANLIELGELEVRSGVDATLAPGGSVSGRLVSPGGSPLSRCFVQAVDPRTVGIRNPGHSGTQHLVTRMGRTNSRGEFSIDGLSTGNYLVRLTPGGGCRNGIQYFAGSDQVAVAPGAAGASPVAVRLGEETAIGDMLAKAGSTLAGRIHNSRSSTRVVVRDAATGQVVRSKAVRPRRVASYSFGALLPGSYRVTFNRVSGQSRSAAQFYDRVAEQDGRGAADLVTIGEDEPTVGIDAFLVTGGVLRGRLVDESGEGIRCTVQAVDPRTAAAAHPGNTGRQHLVTRTGTSRAHGGFTIRGLSEGTYAVRVVPSRQCRNGIGYATGDGQSTDKDPAQAVPSQAVLGSTVKVGTLVYPRGGGIAGQIDLPAGGIGSDLRVIVRDAEGRFVGAEQAANDGSYSVRGLGAGSYRVTFNRVSGVAYSAPQIYDGTGEGAGADGATRVVIDADGDLVRDIDATLVEGGRITGKLVYQSGRLAKRCEVQAFTRSDRLVTRTDRVNQTGRFFIRGLSTGNYRLRVIDCAAGAQFYTGEEDGSLSKVPSDQALIPVVVGQPTSVETLTYDEVGIDSISNVTRPSITGRAQVGSTMTTDGGGWNPQDVDLAFQWRRDGSPIAGATNASYDVLAADRGTKLSVRVVASAPGFRDGAETSAESAVIGSPAIANVVAPTVSGAPEVGQVLTATNGTWDPADVTLTFQWLAGGAPVVEATSATYTLVRSDLGKRMSVRVTAAKDGFDPAAKTSAETEAVADTTAPDTAITSGPDQGSVVRESSVVFAFTGSPSGDSDRFECRVDAAAFSACTSPTRLTGLSDGLHAFEVRAVDAVGNADTTPAARSFTVDTRPVVQPPSAACTQAEADSAAALGQVSSVSKKLKAAKKQQSKAKKAVKKAKKSEASSAKKAKQVKKAKAKVKKAKAKVKKVIKSLKSAVASFKDAQNRVDQNC